MRCCKPATDAERINASIDSEIRDEARQSEFTLLLLGAGESGKSTVRKQFKILHDNGFSDDERGQYRDDIRNNCIQAFQLLLRATTSKSSSSSSSLKIDSTLQAYASEILSNSEYNTSLTPELARKIAALWKDAAVRSTFENRGDMQIQSNAELLIDSVERIAAVDYIPSQDDILYCRVRTTGVIDLKFTIDRVRFRVIDIGGQRCERKKWIHFFEGVSALLYVIALDEYDLTLFEDEKTNRMFESLHLFGDMVNNPIFAHTPTILFLNKKDLLREKIARVNLAKYFPDYKGGTDYRSACDFIKSKYLKLNKSGKTIYTHYTCATSTRNIHKVFEDVRHSVLMGTLSSAGVL